MNSSSAAFVKETRKAFIWVYGGEKHSDQNGENGYRIEIIYR